MAKAAPPKGPPKEAKGERTQKQRFIDTAKALGADESGETFERTLGRLIRPKKGRPLCD